MDIHEGSGHPGSHKQVLLQHAEDISFRLKDGRRFVPPGGDYSLTDTSLVWHYTYGDSVRVIRFAEIEEVRIARFHKRERVMPFSWMLFGGTGAVLFAAPVALFDNPTSGLQLFIGGTAAQAISLSALTWITSDRKYRMDKGWEIVSQKN